MGKKPAAKKKGRAVDPRGYATVSVPSAKKAAEQDDEPEEPEDGPEEAPSTQAGTPAAGGDGDELEEWERLGEEDQSPTEEAAAAAAAAAGGDSQDQELGTATEGEEWDRAIENRVDEELKLDRRVGVADATAQLESKGGAPPAGVVVLTKPAEQKVEAALAPLRDEEGFIRMTFPRHWRYKGKLTYERLNGIHLTLEALQFKGEQVRWAMQRTFGYDIRAALEFLLVNLPKEELPRQFGGESTGEEDVVTAAEEAIGKVVRGPVGEVLQPPPAGKAGKAKAFAPPARAEAPAEAPEAEAAEAPEDGQELGAGDAPAAETPAAETAPAEKGGKQGMDHKQWAMQYCERCDSDSDCFSDEEARIQRQRKRNPTGRYLRIVREFEELAKLTKALKEKKRHGAFKQNISLDMQRQKEAAERMAAIRAEVAELEAGKYGKLNQELIQRTRAASGPPKAPQKKPFAPEELEKAGGPEAAPAEADSPELPSLFDCDAGGEGDAADAEPRPPLLACRSYVFIGWTGRTPKQVLEEYVRKRVWGTTPSGQHGHLVVYERAQPSAVDRHWFRAAVQLPKGKGVQRFDPEEACDNVKDAEHLAATFALLRLSEEHERPGLSRSLPPVLRQRWQEWEQEALRRAREAQRDFVRSRVVFLEKLLRTKPSLPVPAVAGAVASDNSSDRRRGGNEVDWSEDAAFADLNSDAAAALRGDFWRRRENLKDHREFNKIQQNRAVLPVADYRDQLLRLLSGGGVFVVSGATGSGKTTQVPQFVLEDAMHDDEGAGPLPYIIVTEPRRISAVSVAKRVSQEIGDPPGGPGARGSLVGYQIRMERRATQSTRLLFCTVGVLLRQLQQGPSALARVSHVFVDEVHERSADCDLLMLLLRQLRQGRPDLRVVVMSATLEVDKLVRYFGHSSPVVSIPGRAFPVQTFWLEDAVEMTGYRCEDDSEFVKRGWSRGWGRKETFQVTGQGGKVEKLTEHLDDDEDWVADDEAELCDPSSYSSDTVKVLARMDHTRINYDLVLATLELIETSPQFEHVARDDGAVLVFLPGLMEITKVYERLMQSSLFGDGSKFLVLSLHSVLSGDEHAKAFEPPRRGVRKIVLSTNIAETGVTIPDVVFVVDCGKVKNQSYHEPSNTSSLKEQFVSRAEAVQRRGRAGRVREGFCFHLVTSSRFQLRLAQLPTPEILRCSLTELMLSVLSSGLQPSCFSEALDPPPKTRIDQAVSTLKATGAVEEGPRPANALQWGNGDDPWYVATALGQCLARLPCDVRLGKMALLAGIFGSVDAVWTVAATLSHRSPLTNPFSDSKRAQARQVHCAELLPKDWPASDHIALNTAYVRWEAAKRDRQAENFCRKSWLSGQVLQAIRDIRNDLVEAVKSAGFCEQFGRSEVPPQEMQSHSLTSALLFAGLYPNVARIDAPRAATDLNPVLTAGAERPKLHPGSLCHARIEGLHRGNHRWLCYHTKLKTSQVFLRDATFLPPNALLLFGGDAGSITIHPTEKSVAVGSGGERHWHTLYVAPRSAATIRQLRYSFDALLRRKATNSRPLGPEDRAVIAAYIAVATC